MRDLLIIVPARSRPQNIPRLLAAWDETNAWEDAEMRIDVDADDPTLPDYLAVEMPPGARMVVADVWRPLVPKLERAVAEEVDNYWALGFAGCDHVPRSHEWARRYIEELCQLGTGIVYGDDGYQHKNLPTQWAMTADVIKALGRMVPAQVEHLYCDEAIRDLGRAAGCIKYVPDVLIEHMHPAAKKTEMDEQYRRVNSSEQYRRDRNAFRSWMNGELQRQVRALRKPRRQR